MDSSTLGYSKAIPRVPEGVASGSDPRESVSNVQTQAIQKELDSLTAKGSLYWDVRDPKNPERLKIVDRVNMLRNALAGEQAHGAKDKLSPEDQVTAPLSSTPAGWDRVAEVDGRQVAASLGVPGEMVDSFTKAVADGGQGQQYADAESCDAACRVAFGGDYEATLFEAKHAYAKSGPEIQALLERSGLGNNVAAIKAMSEIGRQMIDAEKNIAEVMADSKHSYHRAADPLHAAAVKDMEIWHQILAPFSRNLGRAH
jgi:hypothetical protein